ncbi:ATP-binding protein [Marispirochaeta aestuarii]|uniref:ATP-binding protein n=1 Tax=Marispirochaeta aestuarii TaxID=1963862 RepID=A0A1Y1RW02_9SPIO|nr:MinD/ParA family protein [Marispirochaeta aestuarii]ORC34257.1 ATP-binding protein [Marispirochaeta aestuarii]
MTDQAEQLREIMRSKNGAGNQKTRIIAVASGKGGVGKTNLSINIALAYARLGKKVIVMDADLGLANVNVVLGIIPKYNLYHLIRKQKNLQEILLDTNYGIQIIAGASGFSKIANLSDEEREHFIEELSGLSEADVIVIDTSAGVSHNVLDFIAAADEALIVTTPEPTAITDAYGIIKIIATEIDNMNLGLKLIVNRVKSVTEGKKVSERVISIAGQFLNLKVDYLGYVYDDPVVSSSVLKQKPFMVVDPNSKAAICVKHIVGRLEKVEYREGSGIGNFIRKLLGKD